MSISRAKGLIWWLYKMLCNTTHAWLHLLNVKRKRFWCNCGTRLRCQYWKWSPVQDNVCSDVSDERVASSWNKFTPTMEAGLSETSEHTTLKARRLCEQHPLWQHDNFPKYFINQTNEQTRNNGTCAMNSTAGIPTHSHKRCCLTFRSSGGKALCMTSCNYSVSCCTVPSAGVGYDITEYATLLAQRKHNRIASIQCQVLKRIDFLTNWKVTLVTWHQKEAQHSKTGELLA